MKRILKTALIALLCVGITTHQPAKALNWNQIIGIGAGLTVVGVFGYLMYNGYLGYISKESNIENLTEKKTPEKPLAEGTENTQNKEEPKSLKNVETPKLERVDIINKVEDKLKETPKIETPKDKNSDTTTVLKKTPEKLVITTQDPFQIKKENALDTKVPQTLFGILKQKKEQGTIKTTEASDLTVENVVEKLAELIADKRDTIGSEKAIYALVEKADKKGIIINVLEYKNRALLNKDAKNSTYFKVTIEEIYQKYAKQLANAKK